MSYYPFNCLKHDIHSDGQKTQPQVLSINHRHYAGKNADAINCLPHTKKIVC